MPYTIHLSDHCLMDHMDDGPDDGPKIPLRWLVRLPLAAPLLLLDKKMHFTGARGLLWRTIGVRRSSKNPNVCNV